MPNFKLSDLTPAEHPDDEPELVNHGWSAADLDEDELVDDEHIKNDPDNDL